MAEKLILNKKNIYRVKTYIEGIDDQMEGGIPSSHVVLMCGVSGTMKSSVTFNILYNEALIEKNGLFVSLEQSSTSLINHMVNMGFDMNSINIVHLTDLANLAESLSSLKSKKGNLVIVDLGAIRKVIKETTIGSGGDWLNVIKNLIRKMKESCGLDLLVLDSLSALYVLSNFEHPRNELFYIFEFFRDMNLTTFLISEMPLSKDRYGEFEIEDFLADGVIRLDLIERQRKVVREIAIVKMRATACNVDVFTLEFEHGKFKALYGGKPALI